ncbi:hypothetical protein ACTWQN_12545 [Saccharopolyspora sp. 5N708]
MNSPGSGGPPGAVVQVIAPVLAERSDSPDCEINTDTRIPLWRGITR